MKNSRFDTISSLKASNVKSKLDLSKIKSTDINILLNKVRLDQKNDFRKSYLFFNNYKCIFGNRFNYFY